MHNNTNANLVADYFLWLWSQEPKEDRDFFTPMKLQKMLYYVQGWSLAELGKIAFPETIQAWKYGPVVPEVWSRYKLYGSSPILEGPSSKPDIADDLAGLICQVWEYYKRFSATELSRRTHDERPWKEAWGDMPRDQKGSNPLNLETMRREFHQQLQNTKRRLREHHKPIRAMATFNTRKLTGRDTL